MPDPRMASLAVILRKGDAKVADAAELIVQDPRHREMLGRFFLDIEYIRMTVGAVQPFDMLFMRKNSGRDPRHLGPQRKRPVKLK